MRDQPIMQEYTAISATAMTSDAAHQKSILRKRTTSEGDALKAPRKDDDIADLIGGGWKALGLDFDDDAVPSVMSAQVAVVKEFDKSAAKDIKSIKNLGAKKVVDKSKFGGGPCLFGQGKVPVPQAVPTKSGASVKVNMEDPSSLLKDGSAPDAAPSQPPKQLPLPPLLKKKDSTPIGALNNALTRALSQPGSRAVSRPGSPSRVLSLPPDSPQQNGGISNLLSMAAQDLQSSITAESSCVSQQQSCHQASSVSSSNHQSSTYQGIDNSAMSQIMQNTTLMKSNANTQKASVWGFSEGGFIMPENSSKPFVPLSKSKSISSLNFGSDLEINDPKPREEQKPTASFKPLEPSHQTHNSPIKVPKPVSPTAEGSKVGPMSKKTAPPPVEARGSVLAPKKDGAQSKQIGTKKTDYSYYLDLINDGSEDVHEEKCQANSVQVKQLAPRSFAMEESISKNSVKSTKSMFENSTSNMQQSKNMSKSCGNLNKLSMSTCNGGLVSSKSPMSQNTQLSFNEPKLQGTAAASASTQLKVQSGHNLASLLAKDDMQSSMVISEVFDQSEDLIIKESLVQNVKATSAKWNESLKKEEKVITFGQNTGVQKQSTILPKGAMNSLNSQSMVGKTAHSSTISAKTHSTQMDGYGTGLGLSSGIQNGNLSQYAGNPEQLLKSMQSVNTSSHATHVQQLHQSASIQKTVNGASSMQKSVNGSASIAVLEQQKKIELERQKQIEYEMNQRKGVLDKDAQRNLISKQNEENELQLQLDRRRSLENQLAEQQMKQQQDEKRRQEALQIRLQEEQRQKAELDRQHALEIQRQEEQRRSAEAERVKAIALQKQEEERRKAEIERNRRLELQRQEEQRRKAEAEKQRLLEIQHQEEERKRQEAEKQRLLEIQRQQEAQLKAEAERKRLLELKRQEEERLKLEKERAIELQKQEEEERRRKEEQLRIEEQRRQEEEQRIYEEEQRQQFQAQQAKLQLEARHQQEMEIKRYQESQFQLEQQQRIAEIHSLKQSVSGTDGSFDEEREKRQKIHEDQLRLLHQKQEEEQKQLLLLHQQEEALWESKKSFIQKSSSSLVNSLSQSSTSSKSCEVSSCHQFSSETSSKFEEQMEAVRVHEPIKVAQRSLNGAPDRTRSSASVEIEMFQPMEAVSAIKEVQSEESHMVEYSAPVIHAGSRPSSSQTMNIPSVAHVSTPETKAQTPTSPMVTETASSKPAAPVASETKFDIVHDPLSFLLSDSPASISSSASSAALTPSPVPSMIIPSAPAPPPLQPSYTSIATGDAISELKTRFNETPLQSTFNDPIAPLPPASSTTHNPPSKMHLPAQNNVMAPPPRVVPQSPTSSTRAEVVSPTTQKKRVMAQCMSEVAGIKNAAVLPSQVKAAKRKTTKSRVERFIEATCGDPQTVVRKTASGQEYLEVISPESTELARSLLEPGVSR